MVNLQVTIISREMIKPSSPTIHHQKPYKFPIFSQLTPTTYSPLTLFLPRNDSHNSNTTTQTLAHLKQSLSETLNVYYPFSGRTLDNLFITSFDQGIPFLEARVNCKMSEFLKHLEVESLNKFLPCQPFTKESQIDLPIVALQASFFTCGGLVLGFCLSHKLIDAPTCIAFINAWASVSRTQSFDESPRPNFTEASLFYPPKNTLPQDYLSLMESLWFTEANYVTRRFVFDEKAIASLKAKAKGSGDEANKPLSRIEVLSCFIWKCCMASSKATSSPGSSSKPSILVEAVNLRPRTKPVPMSNTSIGDVFWWASAVSSPSETNLELSDLVSLLSVSISQYDTDYAQSLQGGEGYETISEYCNQLQELFALEKPDILAFTSWCHLGVNQVDFGWGEPLFVGVMGKSGPEFRNLTVFVETKDGKGIEAWINLDEARMKVLEVDPEFLTFASPSPRISSL